MARGQITGTDEGLHIKDPKGDELYLKFMAQALQPTRRDAAMASRRPNCSIPTVRIMSARSSRIQAADGSVVQRYGP